MKTNLEESLCRIISAVEFQADGTFVFAGLTAKGTEALRNYIYAHCYTREFTGIVEDAPAHVGGATEDAWIDTLSAANSSKERWEEGWQIEQFLPGGTISAKKGAAQRTFWPGEFVRTGDYGLPPGQGTAITVFLPRESRSAQPGFYFVFGETPAAQEEESPTVRFYWNVKPEGAAPLTKLLSEVLNRYQVPFRFKIVSHPAFLDRSDTAVLYLGRRYYRVAAALALETRERLAGGLEQKVPLFTLPLAAGLAFAEDPGTQESFGMSRCRFLAEGLWQAHNEGITGTEERLNRVSQFFAAAGTSLERPYLNSASQQTYEFPQ